MRHPNTRSRITTPETRRRDRKRKAEAFDQAFGIRQAPVTDLPSLAADPLVAIAKKAVQDA